ncbi:uncharacterized protein V6R79_005245 [Siganus canaliculatus]
MCGWLPQPRHCRCSGWRTEQGGVDAASLPSLLSFCLSLVSLETDTSQRSNPPVTMPGPADGTVEGSILGHHCRKIRGGDGAGGWKLMGKPCVECVTVHPSTLGASNGS